MIGDKSIIKKNLIQKYMNYSKIIKSKINIIYLTKLLIID